MAAETRTVDAQDLERRVQDMYREVAEEPPLDAGWAALSGGDWERARAFFEESLAEGETPEALEGMGWVGHMLNEDRLTFDARERAYRLYVERGDKRSAARIAAWLAVDGLLFRGEPAVANGWLQRAHSLIDGLEPGVDHGWLAIHEGYIAVALDEDTVKARRLAARAVELGRVFGAPEVEMLGLGLEGRALVSEGELEEGMRRLDEATTVALDGEARLLYCVAWACCYVISACERVRDYERAAQWCARVGEFCRKHDIFLLNTCRAHYASVLSWQGRWDEAESQLSAAVKGLQASRPPMGRWRWPAATTTLRAARSRTHSICSPRAMLGLRPLACGSTSPPR
jgi:LuxR family transcriptional regulator, maltose regulon positive regulatory protein